MQTAVAALAWPKFVMLTLLSFAAINILMPSDLGTWFRTIPIVTRYWFALSVVIPLLGRFGLINPLWMYLDWDLFVHRFHGICMAAGVYFLLEPMVLSVLYVWCQLNKDTIVSFWFGTQFKAMYLPWILCAFNAILRGGGMNELLGILVGHTYYFLAFDYPLQHGGSMFLRTPQFLYNLLPNEEGGVHGFGAERINQRRGDAGGGGRHAWGRGQALGEIYLRILHSITCRRLQLAMYLPWILCAFNAILRGGGMNELLGILVGHTYYFLAFDYPLQHGGSMFLRTPQFLYNLLPNEEGGVHGFGAERINQRRGDAGGGRHAWGRGQALGGD
ncbi:unnamed protein product [Cylicostephanus goldi]|uniref:Derlin n=1 Tax=Cylicostephanus goldi TaxID=71465 RepID=A0A3P7MPP0_CYLGO|nr:unnamed protein product [Cylicostephanus goldi]